MSDYTQATSFGPKDNLTTGDAAKKIKGSEFDVEFAAIETAISTKANKIGGATDGNIVAMTSTGDIKDLGKSLAGVISDARPTGEITMYVAASAPAGWKLCDGSAISRTTYSGLYAIIGTTYGSGDGSTTFNLPDLKGRIPVGYGTGSGLSARSLAATGGAETVTLTASELPDHEHTMFQSAASGTAATAGSYVSKERNGGGDNDWSASTAGAAAPTVGKTGGIEGTPGSAHENMPPFVVVNFIIKT